MTTPRNRQDLQAAREAAHAEQDWVVEVERSWLEFTPEEAAKYPGGVSFHTRPPGGGYSTVVKLPDGRAWPVSVLNDPPEDYIREEALRQANARVPDPQARLNNIVFRIEQGLPITNEERQLALDALREELELNPQPTDSGGDAPKET